MFILDSKLANDSIFIGELALCKILLMNDSNYPWIIMVPSQNNLREITDLSFADQIILLKEINFIVDILKQEFAVDKFNIANLGNVVSQLHIHVIARKKDDKTFPKPVWGNAVAVPYSDEQIAEILQKLQKYFTNDRK